MHLLFIIIIAYVLCIINYDYLLCIDFISIIYYRLCIMII